MKSVKINDNVRYIALNDESGDFGMFVIHAGDRILDYIEINTRDEFVNIYTQISEKYSSVPIL